MDVLELRIRKQQLEKDIQSLIDQFIQETTWTPQIEIVMIPMQQIGTGRTVKHLVEVHAHVTL